MDSFELDVFGNNKFRHDTGMEKILIGRMVYAEIEWKLYSLHNKPWFSIYILNQDSQWEGIIQHKSSQAIPMSPSKDFPISWHLITWDPNLIYNLILIHVSDEDLTCTYL